MDEKEFSFGATESPMDIARITADMVSAPLMASPNWEINLYDAVKKLCNQRQLGICTMCCVRKMAEQHFADNIELSEYWGYLIGKVLIEGGLYYEGSAILYMLKGANKFGIPTKDMEEKYPLKKDGSYQEFVNHFNSFYGGRIPAEIMENAKAHMIPGYYQVNIHPATLATEIQNGKLLGFRFAMGGNTYTAVDGRITWSAKDLLPLRAPNPITGGHAWGSYKHTGLGQDAKFAGLQSWSEAWCADNLEDGPGRFNFIFNVQAPKYFTEAWAIMDKSQKFIFNRDLTIGSSGADVIQLQKIMVARGYLVMPKNTAYGYFGGLTRSAVIKYQVEYGIKPSVGYFGPITRKHLNSHQ